MAKVYEFKPKGLLIRSIPSIRVRRAIKNMKQLGLTTEPLEASLRIQQKGHCQLSLVHRALVNQHSK